MNTILLSQGNNIVNKTLNFMYYIIQVVNSEALLKRVHGNTLIRILDSDQTTIFRKLNLLLKQLLLRYFIIISRITSELTSQHDNLNEWINYNIIVITRSMITVTIINVPQLDIIFSTGTRLGSIYQKNIRYTNVIKSIVLSTWI